MIATNKQNFGTTSRARELLDTVESCRAEEESTPRFAIKRLDQTTVLSIP